MTPAFLVCFLAYVVHSVFSAVVRKTDAPRKPGPAAYALQTPLFLLATLIGYEYAVFSRQLVNPFWIATGLLVGHLLFALASMRMHDSWRAVLHYLVDIRGLWRFLVDHPELLFRFIAVSIAEELIYRVAAQQLLIGATHSVPGGIGIVAVAFALTHWHFLRDSWARSAEFLLFSLLLGLLYYLTGSFILVVTVHTVRNLEIVYHEYLIKLETGSPEAEALAELRVEYPERSLEQP